MNSYNSPSVDSVNALLAQSELTDTNLSEAVQALVQFNQSSDSSTFGIEERDILPDIARCLQGNWDRVQTLLNSEDQASIAQLVNKYGDQSVRVEVKSTEA